MKVGERRQLGLVLERLLDNDQRIKEAQKIKKKEEQRMETRSKEDERST